MGCAPDFGQVTAIRVNDMIIAVNGKEVGGMTVQGLELELATTGAILFLTISRYKHAEHIEVCTARAEDQVMAAIDDALDDDCYLGWRYDNIAGTSETSLSQIASKALDSQLQTGKLLIGNAADNQTTKMSHSVPNEYERTPQDQLKITAKTLLSPTLGGFSTPNTRPLLVTPKLSSSQKVVRFQSDSTLNNLATTESLENMAGSKVGTLEAVPHEKSQTLETSHLSPNDSPVIQCSRHDASCEEDVDSVSRAPDFSRPAKKSMGVVVDSESKCKLNAGESDKDDDDVDNDDEDDDSDDDGNPACGCVCGTIHGGQFVVFWIQCDECCAWYNVARKCVGFTEEEAHRRGKWSCWACAPPEDVSEDEVVDADDGDETEASEEDGHSSDGSPETNFLRKIKRRRKPIELPPQNDDPNYVIPKGTFVEVDREGSNLYGGMGKVVDSFLDEDGDRYYSIKYVIEGYLDKPIYPEYINIRQDMC